MSLDAVLQSVNNPVLTSRAASPTPDTPTKPLVTHIITDFDGTL